MVMSCLMRDGYFSGEGVTKRHGGKGILKRMERKKFINGKGKLGKPSDDQRSNPRPQLNFLFVCSW